MANDFVQVPFSTDSNSIADDATTRLAARWPGWTPEDADLEVQIFECIAPMAADLGSQISTMDAAALEQLGALFGIVFEAGTQATTTVTLTAVDSSGYLVAAGAEVEIDGYAFALVNDALIPNGSTVQAGVEVACNTIGATANGLTGALVAPLSLPPFITGITVDTPTSGGADAEDSIAFRDRVSRDLRLRAKTLVTVTDFVLEALDTAGIGFAWGVGNTARLVTVAVAGADGLPAATLAKDALAATYALYTVANTVVTIEDATYTTISVYRQVKAYPGWDTADLASRLDAALASFLSPQRYGQIAPAVQGAGPSPVIRPVIQVNKLIALLGNIDGVDDVESVVLTGSNIAQIRTLLSTGGAITSLPVVALVNALGSGKTFTVTDPTSVHTQTWTTTAPAALGATTVAVVSQTPNFAYPVGSKIAGEVVGDLTMAGDIPLPIAGPMTGVVD